MRSTRTSTRATAFASRSRSARLTGADHTSVVYFEIAPGDRLGTHTDSAEEILYIVAGEGEAEVGAERSLRGAALLMRARAPEQLRAASATGSWAAAAVVFRMGDGAGASNAAVANAPTPAGRSGGRNWTENIETSPWVSSGQTNRDPARRL